ncbi:hypothetical protein DASC09_048150 [Saccharomycopsis crataegensis]|uniref:Uncharacterized protein n=1 Tax=Saccharomycopsis crataegensis TaxID=43959 RepID=A0AAV5QTC5_9ASCO|nr:hypothetical protein DASC09_048150 [Saccharomycopsis crataegensis]
MSMSTLFNSKTFNTTYKAHLGVLLALFVICMIVLVALVLSPVNRRSVLHYKKRKQQLYPQEAIAEYRGNTYNDGTSIRMSTLNPVTSDNPFYQKSSDISRPSNIQGAQSSIEEPVSLAVDPRVSR